MGLYGGVVKLTKGRKLSLGGALAALLLTVNGAAQAGSITLNLKGADINTLIATVSEVTGKNFLIDPRVKGKITIISSKALDEGQLYQVFLSTLEVHGFSAVPAGKVIKILPSAEAKHSGIPMVPESSPGYGDEVVTRVLEVQHVSAAQLVPILRPLVPPQGHLAAYPQSNMLIVADTAENIRRLVNIIERVDQPSSGEIEFITLEHASASDVVRVLNTLQQQDKKAAEVPTDKPVLVADDRTNSILIGGEKATRMQVRAIIAHLDTPKETLGDTHVIYLHYAKAKDLVPVLTGVQQTQAKAGGPSGVAGAGGQPVAAATAGARRAGRSDEDVFDIQADESTNALVITAPPAVFRSLEQVIQKLDIRRAQVLVEAIIAEVSLTTSAQLGVEWAAMDRNNGNRPAGVTNLSGNLVSNAGVAAAGTGTPSIPSGITLGVGKIVKDGLSFVGLLNALKTDGSTNILSTPNLMTLDNEPAEIFVGNEVSIPSGSFTNTGTGGSSTPTNPFTTFNRTKIGLSLKVKPQISEGDTIKLEIEQDLDGIVAGNAGANDLQTSKRSIKTMVMVDDGRILVLGGLIKEDLTEAETKVPLLGDIPLLGALFRHSATNKVKTNLMVFLRPVISRDIESGLRLTQSKYDYIRGKQLDMQDEGATLISDSEVPVAPKFDEKLVLPPPFSANPANPSDTATPPAPPAVEGEKQ